MPGRVWLLVWLLIWSAATPAAAQVLPADPARLTLDRIFASDDFRPDRTAPVKWLEGGAYTTLQPSAANKDALDIVRVDAAGKAEVLIAAEKLVPPGNTAPLTIDEFELSQDLDLALIYTNSVKVWRKNTRGDYWTFRRSSGKLARLGSDAKHGNEAKPATLMFAKLSPDGTRVAYVREHNLFVEPADGGSVTPLTSDGSATIINGTFDWVYEEEFGCQDGWRWSPDGQQIAYWQLDTSGVPTFTLIDNTTGTYPSLKTFAYPKAGERNSACRIGVVPAAGGATKWIDVPGETRTDYYLPRMAWAKDPQELVIQRINRLQNAVDVMLADPATGKVRTVVTERDGAWVDIHDDHLAWVEQGQAFSWISERDGWRHLYIVSRDGKAVRRVTSGEFDVIKVLHIDEKAGRVCFLASPENPTHQYLYSVALHGGGSPERLTPADQPGWHEYDVSSDGQFAVHTYSAFALPPRSEIVALAGHQVVRTLAEHAKLHAAVEKLARLPPEFFQAEIGGGVQLDGWLLKPADFDPTKKYPLLIYVYGEPAGQAVKDRWFSRGHLWHMLLAQQGYLVACVDNRGTPCPRGRDWRKAAYRQIGRLASEDQAAATRELLKRPYVDAARVGVWGWSGGGSMTLNLLFRYPELYHTGLSVASVPDMRLYDTIYQERYMGLPQDNAEDYKQGSPITHAEGLKGNLLLVHGSGDDNCHAQGMEKLVNRLIELNKPFAMMSYPNRSHAIDEGKNTQRHLFELLTRYLNDKLPAGPRP